MAFSTVQCADIADAALLFYLRGPVLSQTMQDKPLLRWLNAGKKTFPGGKDSISGPVQGAYMSDSATFLQGLGEAEQLTFSRGENIDRWQYDWKQVQASFYISWRELLTDGISVGDHSKTSEHSQAELTRLTGILENRLDDYFESLQRAMNEMFWKDGTQDTEQVAGILSILTDTPAVGTTGNIDRAVKTWWRHRVNLALVASGDDQSVMQFLNAEVLQLRKRGGRPNKILAGSDFIGALRTELVAKGQYTQSGFASDKATDMGIAGLSITGLGSFEYDPTLDDLGMSKRAFVMDGRRIVLRPIEGEDMKPLLPERPYDYLVFLKTTTWTGALTCSQLNSSGVYGIA